MEEDRIKKNVYDQTLLKLSLLGGGRFSFSVKTSLYSTGIFISW